VAYRYSIEGVEIGPYLFIYLELDLKQYHVQQAGNFVREEILSAFIRLVAHTPELQAYTASKLYVALQADISQESLTLAATWVIGEYSDILLEGGIVDEDQPKQVSKQHQNCNWSAEAYCIYSDNRQRHSRPSNISNGLSLRQLSYSTICCSCRHQNLFPSHHIPRSTITHRRNLNEVHHKSGA
jgi:hypothetical protein